MKKVFLALGILIGASLAHANDKYSNVRVSYSFTTQTPAVLFSSTTIEFVAVHVSSQVLDGRLVIFRSTTSVYTHDVASMVIVNTSYVVPGGINPNQVVPLYDMRNSSYTHIQKVGAAETSIFFRCIGETGVGNCPGIPYSGQKVP